MPMKRLSGSLAGRGLLPGRRADCGRQRIGERGDRPRSKRVVVGHAFRIPLARLRATARFLLLDDAASAVPVLLLAPVRLALFAPELIGAHPDALFAIGFGVNGHANLLL